MVDGGGQQFTQNEFRRLLSDLYAKTQFLSGNTLAAQNSLGQARDIAPDHELAHYSRLLGACQQWLTSYLVL